MAHAFMRRLIIVPFLGIFVIYIRMKPYETQSTGRTGGRREEPCVEIAPFWVDSLWFSSPLSALWD